MQMRESDVIQAIGALIRLRQGSEYGAGRRVSRTMRAFVMLMLPVSFYAQACGVKRTVAVAVPPKILQARTASLEELLGRLDSYNEQLTTLSSTTLKISYTSGKVESGKLQEYRSAPGYVLLKRPDSLRLNIQNPVTKTTIAELASVGDDFSLWYPRENKYFVGRNSAKEFDLEDNQKSPVFTARPIHILEAIIPRKITIVEPRLRISLEEDGDASAKYYVVSVFEGIADRRLRPLRRIWFERSDLAVVRQKTFNEDGSVASVVSYSNLKSMQRILLPLSIRIDRPSDGYSLDLEFKVWRVNFEIPPAAFVLAQPPSADRINLKEKTQN